MCDVYQDDEGHEGEMHRLSAVSGCRGPFLAVLGMLSPTTHSCLIVVYTCQ